MAIITFTQLTEVRCNTCRTMVEYKDVPNHIIEAHPETLDDGEPSWALEGINGVHPLAHRPGSREFIRRSSQLWARTAVKHR